MKRGVLILLFGLVAGMAAYGCFYYACTSPARQLQRSEKPELAWLRDEFKLSDTEFKRVSELHFAYLPQCQEMCRKIDAQNEKLQSLLSNSTNMTPEIASALAECARMRSECQTMMISHFFEVSRTMPPDQGRRYLLWVKQKAFLPNYGMTEQQ